MLNLKFWEWGRKTTPSELVITHKFSRDTQHPEKKQTSIAETNKDANILRYTNDIVASYSKTVKRGVVGTGFSLQFKTEDVDLNREVESWLEYCSELGNFDITKRLMRQEAERMITDELAIKGGVIIRHHWDKRHPSLYAPEILSFDTVDRKKNDFSKGLYSGIQTNKMGQITGLWIFESQERRKSNFVAIRNLIVKVLPFDPHQYGNISPLATIMLRLDELSSYTDSELKNAKKRADKSLVASTPMVDKYLTSLEAYMSDKTIDESTREQYKQEYKKLLQEFSAPGFHDSATIVSEGTTITDLQQDGGSQYADLSVNNKQTIAAGLGYSPGTLMKIPEHSYNSALKSAQDEEQENSILGQIVIAICQIIYRNQIEAGLLLNEYDIPDYYQRRKYYDRKLKVTRKIKGHIDPLKQVNADAAEVEAELESRIQKHADNNRDYKDVIADSVEYELEKKKQFEAKGLEYIQTGTEGIALERAKKELDQQEKEEDDRVDV